MRILVIWDSDYPWDVRIEKVCNSLIRAGHETHLICRNQRQSATYEVREGLHIHRLALPPSWLRKANSLLTFPFFGNPLWLRAISRTAARVRADAIVVRDLPLAPSAICAARGLSIPVIFDMAECYPEMLRATWRYENFRVSNIFVRNPVLADYVERWTLKRVDQVWAMVEESQDRLIAMGVPASRIRIVSNTPELSRMSTPAPQTAGGDMLRLIYVGLLNPSRGLDVALDATSRVRRTGLKLHLTIIGTGKAMSRLRQQAERLGLGESFVTFTGWVDNGEVPKWIAAADCGLVPHRECSHWNNTIPNKLFDYMAAKVPVIVSGARPAARIVRETACGLVYENDSSEFLAEKIIAMNDLAARKEMSLRGQAAIRDRYHWEYDERVMVEGISEVINSRSRCES